MSKVGYNSCYRYTVDKMNVPTYLEPRRQKNRAFCYFCQSIQRTPICAHCGKSWSIFTIKVRRAFSNFLVCHQVRANV